MTLRDLLVTLLGVLALYLVGLAVFIHAQVLRPARALQDEAEPVARVHRILEARSRSLSESLRRVEGLVTGSQRASPGEIEEVWAVLQPDPNERPTRSYGGVPAALRGHMVDADEAHGRLANELLETLILFRLDRRDQARQNLAVAEELRRVALDELGLAQQQGLDYVVSLEGELADAAARGIRGVVGWVLIGLLLLPLILFLARRRVAEPLADLDRAATRVASGDLDVELEPGYDDELGALARQFNQMIRVIRSRARAQGHLAAAGELLSGVAHEVKNPLMAISAVASSRLDEADLPAASRDDWTEVQIQSRRAGKIVQDLLKFVKGEDEETVEAVHLQTKLNDAVSLVSYRLPVDEIDFTFRAPEEPIWVRAAPHRLEQVVVNLFSNALAALKQVDPPRSLTLECRVEGDGAVVSVVDTGPGVHPQLKPRLFSPFKSEGSKGGTGLGLYISRNLMRGMDGELHYVDDSGPGARFEARFRLASPPAPTKSPAPAEGDEPERTSTSPLSVLLVEDEEVVRRPVARFLRRKGMEVTEVADGVEALEAVAEGPLPDVVVSDLRMPRMDGLNLLEELREGTPELVERFLILSGDISLFSGGDAPLGPEQILVKPVELSELVDRIRKLAPEGHPPTKPVEDSPTAPT